MQEPLPRYHTQDGWMEALLRSELRKYAHRRWGGFLGGRLGGGIVKQGSGRWILMMMAGAPPERATEPVGCLYFFSSQYGEPLICVVSFHCLFPAVDSFHRDVFCLPMRRCCKLQRDAQKVACRVSAAGHLPYLNLNLTYNLNSTATYAR